MLRRFKVPCLLIMASIVQHVSICVCVGLALWAYIPFESELVKSIFMFMSLQFSLSMSAL